MIQTNRRPTASRWWAAVIAGAMAIAPTCTRPAAGAAVEGADLLRRVQSVYGQSRRAIRSVEYDHTFNLNGNLRKARFAADGERQYESGVWVLPGGGFGMAKESAWDGQRVHDRATLGQLNRSTDRSRFKYSTPVPGKAVDVLVSWALGFEDELLINFRRERQQTFRFLGGRTVEDETHGSCIELDFSLDWKPGTMLTRHARRYAYAPVYWRTNLANGEIESEMIDVAYATVESEGNELYYPVALTTNAFFGPGKPVNVSHIRVDEATLKVNQPLPRSRFVLEPWPNEVVYDIDARRETDAKNPGWSPVGQVVFPWDGFVAAAERNQARRAAAQAGAARGDAFSPEAKAPWAEAWGGWLVAASGAALAGVALVVHRRKRRAPVVSGGGT